MNWTAEDETTAKLIAILVFVAKILEGVRDDETTFSPRFCARRSLI